MRKKEDKDTRYFIDLDVRTQKIISRNYGDRHKLVQVLPEPSHHRVFLTKGQYNKLEQKILEVSK